MLLFGLLVLIVLAIELVANRSALTIIVSYLLFDPGSYWFRRLIWTYGSASVVNHPLFGVGMNEWPRPEWMGASIDNYWLYLAVTHGLPAAGLMLLAFLSVVLPISSRKGLDARLVEYRTAFLITMTALFLVGWTVAFWDTILVLFVFLMGSGVWMLDADTRGNNNFARAGSDQAQIHIKEVHRATTNRFKSPPLVRDKFEAPLGN
jgi:hypothetical protein